MLDLTGLDRTRLGTCFVYRNSVIGDRSEKNVIENEGRGTSVIVIVRGEAQRVRG